MGRPKALYIASHIDGVRFGWSATFFWKKGKKAQMNQTKNLAQQLISATVAIPSDISDDILSL